MYIYIYIMGLTWRIRKKNNPWITYRKSGMYVLPDHPAFHGVAGSVHQVFFLTRRSCGICWGCPGFMVGKWWENDGKMMGKWWEHDGKMMGKWWENDGKMMGTWWENDGKMMGTWWENDGKMRGQWWENDGKMMGQWGCIGIEWDFDRIYTMWCPSSWTTRDLLLNK